MTRGVENTGVHVGLHANGGRMMLDISICARTCSRCGFNRADRVSHTFIGQTLWLRKSDTGILLGDINGIKRERSGQPLLARFTAPPELEAGNRTSTACRYAVGKGVLKIILPKTYHLRSPSAALGVPQDATDLSAETPAAGAQ